MPEFELLAFLGSLTPELCPPHMSCLYNPLHQPCELAREVAAPIELWESDVLTQLRCFLTQILTSDYMGKQMHWQQTCMHYIRIHSPHPNVAIDIPTESMQPGSPICFPVVISTGGMASFSPTATMGVTSKYLWLYLWLALVTLYILHSKGSLEQAGSIALQLFWTGLKSQ